MGVSFVNNDSGAERHEDSAASGEPIDFDPNDPDVVKVHYDLTVWTFDQRAELSEALADAEFPHYWDGSELVVPEAVEDDVDALFERLEELFGPFPIILQDDEESTEFGLDEWSESDRKALTDALIDAEIPHRWDGTTVIVAADAESAVDVLLDRIETGEMGGDTSRRRGRSARGGTEHDVRRCRQARQGSAGHRCPHLAARPVPATGPQAPAVRNCA